MGSERWTRYLALWSHPAAVCAATILVTAASLVTPGFSHLDDLLSRLASDDSRYPWLMRSAYLSYGALMLPLGYAFYRGLGRTRRAALVWLAVTFYSITSLLGGAFETAWPMPGSSSLSGTIHQGAANASGIAILAMAVSIYFASRGRPGWANFPLVSLIASLAAAPFIYVFFAGWYAHLDGLWQKAFFVIALAWIQLVSMKLYWTLGGRSASPRAGGRAEPGAAQERAGA